MKLILGLTGLFQGLLSCINIAFNISPKFSLILRVYYQQDGYDEVTKLYQLVLTTCPDETVAKNIAKHLVTEKLAACINIIANITSVYSWQDELQCDNEVQLLIKTNDKNFAALNERINQLHPYDVVEVIALNIQQGDKHYLNWITNSLK
jgi:periplasmic divalent cation tolerance protein